jgi:hypothetical protein
MPRLVRRLLQAAAVVCALAMLSLAILFLQGSSEMFPTDEQDGKASMAVGLLFVLFLVAEVAVLWGLRRGAGRKSP